VVEGDRQTERAPIPKGVCRSQLHARPVAIVHGCLRSCPTHAHSSCTRLGKHCKAGFYFWGARMPHSKTTCMYVCACNNVHVCMCMYVCACNNVHVCMWGTRMPQQNNAYAPAKQRACPCKVHGTAATPRSLMLPSKPGKAPCLRLYPSKTTCTPVQVIESCALLPRTAAIPG